jgi:molybdopterin-guanine dinucleotide biosynthesis protein
MTTEDSFKIISVTGAHSKVGKTTLCSILLKNLNGYGAIKFTKTPIFTSVADDRETIMQKDKDTAIMAESGAEKVIWIQSPNDGLEDALNIALSKMTGLKGIVVEGNSPVDFLKTHLVIFIIGSDGEIKPSGKNVSEMANIIIINSEKHNEKPAFLNPLLKKNAAIFRIDLIKKEGEIDKFLAHVKKYIE